MQLNHFAALGVAAALLAGCGDAGRTTSSSSAVSAPPASSAGMKTVTLAVTGMT